MSDQDQSTSDEIKEVYARFGVAYYKAECIHRGLCNFYSFLQMPPQGPVTRERVEEHLRDSFSRTLGYVVQTVLPHLPSDLAGGIEEVVKDRNFLAHNFWWERSYLFATSRGIRGMLKELNEYDLQFEEVNERLNTLLLPYLQRIGATPAVIAEQMERVRLGEPDEPLIQQRKPHKVETITAAYQAPVGTGKSRLVFETDDGLLWQLCDVGLGWTSFGRVGNDWTPDTKLTPYLPARVNPRPRASEPWVYTIDFDNKATLAVGPGKLPGQISYRFKVLGPSK